MPAGSMKRSLTVLLLGLLSISNIGSANAEMVAPNDFGDRHLLISRNASLALKLNHPKDRAEVVLKDLTNRLRKRLKKAKTPQQIIDAMAWVVFKDAGFEADFSAAANADLDNVLFHRVLERKKGVCMSLSLIYITLAQRLDLPIYGVSVPDHFFARYDDGVTQINIETLKNGQIVGGDDIYRRDFYIRDGEPFYMENLSKEQTTGVVLSNLGAIFLREDRAGDAIYFLEGAKSLNPTDVESYTNLGMAYSRADRYDDAKQEFLGAVALNGYDDKAHYQLANLFYSEQNYELAIMHYDQSLRLGHIVDYVLLRALEPHRKDSLVKAASPDGAGIS
ncbi:MAG: regulator of sirC expression with transglutaminase-like and TPR domain [Candidatus Omnitrophota bacterium]|jgi:regulator of sirC expression with transglutaminase-like and TPR domain